MDSYTSKFRSGQNNHDRRSCSICGQVLPEQNISRATSAHIEAKSPSGAAFVASHPAERTSSSAISAGNTRASNAQR
ncbi:hypothetical protein FPOA_12645 [Fusarium poae]|uniref:Uncharacterized protein n=1 Tax=Fusarium poae TaxID=36050 RepID=A0A1B8A8I7_FUSPO|nr:hypothetical protein FPOA_12645 [Fusarium poae]